MSIDDDLVLELANEIKNIPEITLVAQEDLESLIQRVATKFVKDPSAVWWWTSLSARFVTLTYCDPHGLPLLHSLIQKDKYATLVVTDDEPGPWPAVSGSVDRLLQLLRRMRYFEYFMFNPSLDWIVFDTHDNQLIVSGSLVDIAQSFGGIPSEKFEMETSEP